MHAGLWPVLLRRTPLNPLRRLTPPCLRERRAGTAGVERAVACREISMHTQSLLMTALCCALALPNASTAQTTTIVITGNPLERDVGAQAASILNGNGLLLRRASTLGETLDGLPGVSASGFGPNASRPVIRGLDGDRVRMLDNGGTAVDASSLSFDHAVALDPLVAERIEVLRGPAALLYGGNATGGVVNVIDNRIPRVRADGLGGRAELRLGGAARERAGAAVLDGGAGGFAWHVDVTGRDTDDLRTPRYTPLEDGVALDPSARVRNSASRSHGGAIGAGWVSDRGHLGLAVDTLRNRYGVTVEPDVTIRLERDRVTLGGEWRNPSGWLRSMAGHAGRTRYQHQEVEGNGEVGTTFKSEGDDLRLQLRHASWSGVEGVWGLQAESLDFSALGEEAFVPSTRTRSQALFALEELKLGPLALSLGGRVEKVRVSSSGDPADAPEPKFGDAASRSFAPRSLSLGARLDLAPGWQLQASAGSTQRAPAYYELYANGVHLATAAFERGDPTLGLERSRHAELGLAWRRGEHHLKFSLFSTRFSSFIALDATGVAITVPGEPGEPDTVVPEYLFQGVRAQLRGAEIEGRTRLLQGKLTLDLSGSLDVVRGDNLSLDEPLPRLAPTRARVGLEAGFGHQLVGLEVRHSAKQTRFSANDTATASATTMDLWARGSLWGRSEAAGPGATWFAKLSNVTDELAFNPVAVATIRGLSPQAGRALSAGVQLRW
jgi:iron complex outermembrane receptor protein